MPPPPANLIVDGFAEFPDGINSGIAAALLKRTQCSYATNCTFRGNYLKPRPSFRKINLKINDAKANLTGVIYQDGAYYQPDFGQESLFCSIGGRLLQFLPDTAGNATVYDRTVQLVSNTIDVARIVNIGSTYSLVLTNITDQSFATYPPQTQVTTEPAFIGPTGASATSTFTFGTPPNYNTLYAITVTFPSGFVLPANLVGKIINFTPPGASSPLNWQVSSSGISAGLPFISAFFNILSGAGDVFTFPAGTAVLLVPKPSPPINILVATQSFAAPSPGQTVQIYTSQQYPGRVGDGVRIGGYIYEVTGLPPPLVNKTSQGVSQIIPGGATVDNPNPVNALEAWMWQAENYLICNDGKNRPIIFDGVSARRSDTASYSGETSGPFNVPLVGSTTIISLETPFTDAVGRYIQVTQPGSFPFLMQVLAVISNTIEVLNVTGLSLTQQNASIGTGATVVSVANPTYTGILATSIAAMPALGTSVTLAVIPPFNGAIGDSIFLSDGTGPITTYELKVTGILGGGSTIICNTVTAPQNLVVAAGFPIYSANNHADELPIGRMGAYVQGRNWISLPSGKAFIASDQNGDSSGTVEFGFRDAVLKWSLNTTKFGVPGGAGRINCIVALSAINNSLGQGALQIGCDNDIFACSAPSDATLWPAVTSPILVESAIGFGICGQGGAVVCNGDLILKSNDAQLHSLQLSTQDFFQWGNYPISREVARIIAGENDDLLQFLRADKGDNRLLMPAQPIDTANGPYAQGLIALDFDVTSSLRGKEPSVYDGLWTGLNVLQVITGTFSNEERTFVFSSNTANNTIELWEVLPDGLFDDHGNGPVVPIIFSAETPVLFINLKNKGEFEFCQLQNGELYVSDLVAPPGVTEAMGIIKVWYRPDFDPCWYFWHEFTFGQDDLPRLGLGAPDLEKTTFTGDRPPTFGRFFQLRIEGTGSFILKGGLLQVSREPQPEFEPPLCNLETP